MAQLPLDQGINRFKENEDRFDKFVNDPTGYTSSGGVNVESVREFLARIEQTIAAYGTLVGKPTLAELNASLAYPAGTMAYVTNDPTTTNNGYYIKGGASGSGSWTRSNYDPVNTLSAEVDVIQASLQTLGLDRLANFFPNGSLTPDPDTGVVWAPSEVTTSGTFGTIETVNQADLASYGLTRAYKLPRTTGNRHAQRNLPLGIGGQYLIMTWITYVPGGTAAAHGNNQAYVGKNGALGDGFNGCTEITMGEIIVNSQVRVHWLRCKLFSTYESAQAWVGASAMGSTTEDVYLTGFNATWTTNAAMGVLNTSYNNFSPSAIQNDIRRLDADMANKVPGYENLVYNNAVKNRFGPQGATASSNIGGRGVVTYHRDTAIFNQDAARNVLKAVYSGTSAHYFPTVTVTVSPQDLADLGIVPNDITPPRISMKAAWVKSLMTQHTSANIQIFFSLRYGGTLTPDHSAPSTDVLFTKGSASPNWAGAGDSSWAHSVSTYSDTLKQGFCQNNIPLPASYNGRPFTGIVISLLGYPTVEGDPNPTTIGMTDIAVIAGASIQPNFLYLNSPDDYAKVGNIQKNQLSTELQGQLVFEGEDVANSVTIQNSDKIILLGDSYTSSHYTMKDKAYIARLAELSDWRFENFSRSGDDYIEINQRILNNINDYHPSIAFKQMGGSHALLISFTNDTYHRGRNLDYFFDNVRRIAQTVMGCGVKPILAMEFVTGNSREITGLSNIARELGIEFVDIASNDRLMDVTRYNQYWGRGHPAVRTNGLFYAPLLPYFNARRPRQGIKMYRKRPTFTPATDADLLYDNIQQRVTKWKELTLGHHSLVERLEPYYDRMTDIADAHGGYSYNANISEYLKLQNKEAVTFSDYALVEVILPSTASRISSAYLNLSDSTVEVYCRNATVAETFDAYTKQQAFVVADFPLVTAGDTYSYSGTTFTISGTATTPEGEKLVLATPRTFSGNLSAGTLIRVSGTGPATVAISAAYDGFAPGYYTDLYKPRGAWKSLTNEAGKVTLSGSTLMECMQYDKLVFLLKKSGGFSLSDIYLDWYGTEGKDYQTFENHLPQGGTQVLTSTKFDTVGSWTLEGGTEAQDPADGVLPRDCTKLIKVSASKRAVQTFAFTADNRYTKEVDVVVWARRYPAEFIPSSDETTALTQYQTTAPINSNTCDYRGLRIQLDNGSALSAIKTTELVGLHWQEVRVRLQLPNVHLAGSSFTLRLDCPDDELELALAEVWVK